MWWKVRARTCSSGRRGAAGGPAPAGPRPGRKAARASSRVSRSAAASRSPPAGPTGPPPAGRKGARARSAAPAGRPPRRRPSAAPRGGADLPQGGSEGGHVERPARAAPPPACCRAGSPGSSRSRNHSRSWAKDSGRSPVRSTGRSAGAAAAATAAGSSSSRARPSTVAFSNSRRSGSSTPKASRTRETSCVGQQRVPPQVEEVVPHAHALDAEQLGPDPGHPLLHRRARRHVPRRLRRRRKEALPVSGPLREQVPGFLLAQDQQLGDPLVRIRQRRGEQGLEVPQQPLDRGGVEELDRVLDRPFEPFSRLLQQEGQIEAGHPGVVVHQLGRGRPAGPAGRDGALSSASDTWNSGVRLGSRAGASSSTSFSNGTSWCA